MQLTQPCCPAPSPLQGFYVFIRALQLMKSHNEGVIVVGLAGASGSGKTAFSEKVSRACWPHSVIVHPAPCSHCCHSCHAVRTGAGPPAPASNARTTDAQHRSRGLGGYGAAPGPGTTPSMASITSTSLSTRLAMYLPAACLPAESPTPSHHVHAHPATTAVPPQ